MASVNKVILVGNLGRDPEIRYMPSGEPVANVTIATSSKYKSKTGEMVEETEWHKVAFFGKLAEIVGQYLKKGKPVYVEGRIKTRKYTDKDGVEKSVTEIIASEMQMLGGKESSNDYKREEPKREEPKKEVRQAPKRQEYDSMDEDIPF